MCRLNILFSVVHYFYIIIKTSYMSSADHGVNTVMININFFSSCEDMPCFLQNF